MIAVRLTVLVSVAIILLASFETSRAYSPPPTYPLGSLTWTLTSTPKLGADLAGTLSVTYRNNLNTTLAGIVYAVVHNSGGQTVAWETTSLNLTAGQTGTAYLDVWLVVPKGNYNSSVFATSLSGVAISNSTWVSWIRP